MNAGTQPSVTRRRFVEAGMGVVAMFAVGGAGKAFAGDRGLLRPPGAQDESRVVGSCIKCDRCRGACPHGAIQLGHVEDGFMNARIPKMDFHQGYCDFCADVEVFRCADACPTQAIRIGFDTHADKIGLAAIDADECLLFRSGTGHCSKQCIDACSFDALSLGEDGHVAVDAAACNGCGACEYACPSASYGSYSGSGRRGINVELWKGVR